jgi:hypothetical protein
MPIENSRCCIRIGAASTVFFAAGATRMERAILGGNRSGKSTCAAYELAVHLTGRYPPWWKPVEGPITA